MTKKLYSLTPEHEAQLPAWRDKWIQNALKCNPAGDGYTAEEKETARQALRGLYQAADLPVPAPEYEVFCSGPISAAIASGVAAGVWWLRENLDKHQELFSKSMNETNYVASAAAACSHVVKTGLAEIQGTKKLTEADYRGPLDAALTAAFQAGNLGVPKKRVVKSDVDDNLVRFLVECVAKSVYTRNGGNQWSGWVAYLSFFRYVAKLDIDYSKWHHYEIAAQFGPRFMHKNFWILSDLPTHIHMDDRNLPHSAATNPEKKGMPFTAWPDGWGLWYWHNVRVPRAWIETPEEVDPKLALTWENVEQRRALAEIVGWSRVLEKLKPKVIQKDEDPQIGELIEVDLPDAPGSRFLRVECGTKRMFVIPVAKEVQTAREGQAWSYGISVEEHKKLAFRT